MTPKPGAPSLPVGFFYSAMACGLKREGLDLALLISDRPASAAAVFTKNLVCAAPVKLSRKHLKRQRSRMRAIIVNSGNANCATGPQGMIASSKTVADVGRALGCSPEQVLVCSTGVIGIPLRVEKILRAAPELARGLSGGKGAFLEFTRAIMTTDTRPKWAGAEFRAGGKLVRIVGCAKGAGMIQPNLATMLAFIVTDARIAPPVLQRALSSSVASTFNAITVDGDTSTNDTVAVLANGASGCAPIRLGSGECRKFQAALQSVCSQLALAIVADGEGAQRVVEIEVRGARSERDAEKVARTIANSPLVKTALAGADPNWGRILAAAGRAGVKFDPEKAGIWLAGIEVCRHGRERKFDERAAHRKLSASHVPILLDLRSGRARARIWTCDFTADYVDINASYRS
jgi:glutamate N-acetyltransferase / amino-acid N-acetyltransferase